MQPGYVPEKISGALPGGVNGRVFVCSEISEQKGSPLKIPAMEPSVA